MYFRKCICGSGKEGNALHDASGIYVSMVCEDCEEKVRAKYRPEIFEDANYYTDEPKEEEDY